MARDDRRIGRPRLRAGAGAVRAQLRARRRARRGVAAYRGGEKVVDLWGGFRDAAATRAVAARTRSSWCTRPRRGSPRCASRSLASRGLLDYDDTVAQHWPEFAANGKEAITIRQLLAHQAGLCAIRGRLDARALADLDGLAVTLARQRPGVGAGHAPRLPRAEPRVVRERADPPRRPRAPLARPLLRRGDRRTARDRVLLRPPGERPARARRAHPRVERRRRAAQRADDAARDDPRVPAPAVASPPAPSATRGCAAPPRSTAPPTAPSRTRPPAGSARSVTSPAPTARWPWAAASSASPRRRSRSSAHPRRRRRRARSTSSSRSRRPTRSASSARPSVFRFGSSGRAVRPPRRGRLVRLRRPRRAGRLRLRAEPPRPSPARRPAREGAARRALRVSLATPSRGAALSRLTRT